MTDSHKHQKVHTFLRHHRMGVLSTVGPDGTPWGAAVYFVADEDFRFYFVTRAGTLKYQNIDNSPLAAFTVADAESQTTVQASGTVTQVPVKEYADVVFNKLAKVRPKDDPAWAPPIDKLREGNYVPLCLTPSKLQYADYGHVKPEMDADYIENVI